VFLPRGVEHVCAAAAGKARVLSFFAPAGFERFYGEMADPGPPDVERLVTTAARYGCEIDGPRPPNGPGSEHLDPRQRRPQRAAMLRPGRCLASLLP